MAHVLAPAWAFPESRAMNRHKIQGSGEENENDMQQKNLKQSMTVHLIFSVNLLFHLVYLTVSR